MARRTYTPKPASEVKLHDVINASRGRSNAEVITIRETGKGMLEFTVNYGARVKRVSTAFYNATEMVEVAQ